MVLRNLINDRHNHPNLNSIHTNSHNAHNQADKCKHHYLLADINLDLHDIHGNDNNCHLNLCYYDHDLLPNSDLDIDNEDRDNGFSSRHSSVPDRVSSIRIRPG